MDESIKLELEKLRKIFDGPVTEDSQKVMNEDDLKKLNEKRYNTLQAKCFKFPTKEGETIAEVCWSKRYYASLLELLLADAAFPASMNETEISGEVIGGKELKDFLRRRTELHEHIKKGDIDYVEKFTNDEKSSLYLGPGNKLGWSCALENEKYEICAIFWQACPMLRELFRRDINRLPNDKQQRIQSALDSYAERFDDPQFSKLLDVCDIFPETSEERRTKVYDLFSTVRSHEMGKTLLKVATRTLVEFEFDFDQELVDERVVFAKNAEAIYLLQVNRIYVATKNCNSQKPAVVGAFIHELCHLAMKTVYENLGKPYRNTDEDRREKYQRIVESTREFTQENDRCDIVLSLAFYAKDVEEAELIVRVVHILAIHGKSEGRKILEEQAKGLLEYFEKYVLQDCEEFIRSNKPMPSIEELNKGIGILRDDEMKYIPKRKVIDGYTSKFAGFPAVYTSNPKLCYLGRYQKMKDSQKGHVKRKCLFLDLDSFHKHQDKIVLYLKKIFYTNLVLIVEDENADLESLEKYLNGLSLDNKESLTLIIYSECKHLKIKDIQILHYTWDDLSDSCREDILSKGLTFQGTNMKLENLLETERVSEIMTSKAIFQVMSKEIIIKVNYQNTGFNIEREFTRIHMKKLLEKMREFPCLLFLTGIKRTELSQYLHDADDTKIHLQPENEREAEKKFIQLCKTQEMENILCWKRPIYWLHFSNDNFYLRTSKGDTGDWGKIETIKVHELIEKTKNDRVVLIAGDPGLGKTTVVSDLMRRIKSSETFVWRVDLNEYAKSEANQISLHRIQAEQSPKQILDYFLSMIFEKENYLEKRLIQSFFQNSHKVVIFFDGYDEIVPYYKMQARKLLHTILEETRVQIWVTSRIHEVINLETEFEVAAFELAYLDSDKQAEFVCKTWKNLIGQDKENMLDRLKKIKEEMRNGLQTECQNESEETIKAMKGEIDRMESRIKDKEIPSEIARDLDLTTWEKVLLKKLPSNKENKSKLFIGIPLHLMLVSELSFRHNLKLTKYSDLFLLYTQLIETRFHIYFKEKAKIVPETKSARDICSSWKEDFLGTHKNIAACISFSNEYPWETLKKDSKIRMTTDFGLITNLKDDLECQFLHYTLTEYFLCQWIVDKWKWGELKAGILLQILKEERFSITRNFLDSFFKRNAGAVEISSSFVKDLKVEENFKRMFEKLETDFSGAYVWKSIVKKFEESSDDKQISRLIMIVAGFISEGFFHTGNNEDLKKLSIAMTQTMLQRFFHDNLYSNGHLFFYFFFGLPIAHVEEAIRFISAMLTKGDIKPVELRDWWWRNAIHSASRNYDCKVFDRVLEFSFGHLEKVLKTSQNAKEVLEKFIMREHTDGMSILHANILCARKNVSLGLKRLNSIFGERTLSELLRREDYNGRSYLQKAYLQLDFDELKHVLDCLRDIDDGSLLKELLLQKDVRGKNLLSYSPTEEDESNLRDIVKGYLDEESLQLFCKITK